MIHRYAATTLFVSLALGCGGEPPPPADTPTTNPPAAVAIDERPLILFVGTSLTAGLGLRDPADAFPALIQARLDSAGLAFRVVNAGVSGETSSGAVRRIDWLMSQGPVAVLFLETGANDGLRGQDPDSLRANIDAILAQAREQDPPPSLILAGMEAPPNLGAQYTTSFRAVFPAAAQDGRAALVPFLLEGVAGVEELNQGDGIHPTAEGHRRIAELVWPIVLEAVREQPTR
jgi:acyl-CoA thioesterase-1